MKRLMDDAQRVQKVQEEERENDQEKRWEMNELWLPDRWGGRREALGL